jgi:hypothetical protein
VPFLGARFVSKRVLRVRIVAAHTDVGGETRGGERERPTRVGRFARV